MKVKGSVVTGLVASLALAGVMMAFIGSSSPYVTVAEARTARGDNLHLYGDILKETVVNDVLRRELRFQLKDERGDVAQVIHTGAPPANMGEATKVVAVGTMRDGAFNSHKLLVKCPSKYEGVNVKPAAKGS